MSSLMKRIKEKFVNITEKWFGKSDLYTQVYLVYVLLGVFMIRKKWIEKNRVFYYIVRIAQVFMTVIYGYCILAFTLDPFYNRRNMEKLTISLCFTMLFMIGWIRVLLAYLKQSEIEKTLNALNNNLYLNFIGRNEEDQEIFKLGEEKLRKLMKFFAFISFLGNSFRVVCKVIDRITVIPVLFIDSNAEGVYDFMFFWDIAGIYYLVTLYAAHELTVAGIFIRIQQHYFILEKNLLNIKNVLSEKDGSQRIHFQKAVSGKLKQDQAFQMLKKSIIHHQEILKIVKSINLLFQSSFFTTVICGGSLLVILFFHLTLQTKGYTVTFIICQALYSVMVVTDIGFVCYWASEIQAASRVAAMASYFSPWLQMDIRNRKTLIFFQKGLWKKLVIKAGLIFSLDLQFSVLFLHSVYTYLTFMQKAINKGNSGTVESRN